MGSSNKMGFPRLIVVPLSITFPDNRFPAFFSSILLFMAVNPGNVAPSSNLFPSGCYTNAIQEQIAASHEFDGVRKEKERLTAASLNKSSCTLQRHINNLSIISFLIHQTYSPC